MTTKTSVHRIFNFSAGPAILPLSVVEEAQRDLVSLPGVGLSVLEISHRSKPFERILQEATADIRALAGIPDDYHVLFLQGGASLQFAMVPMNLIPPGGEADYIVTGTWSQKAVKEAARVGTVHVAASTQSENFTRIPRPDEIRLSGRGAYVHATSNNTIYGTEWREIPNVGDRPLVVDASSNIFSGPLDVARHALIYAGAQKNLGPAGVTLVIIRDDIARRSPSSIPTMLSYATHADNNSLYNTPPAFAIYVVGLVAKWLRREGGLEAIGRRNERKASQLYAEIDRTDFYRGHAQPESRSLMNVTFRLPSEALEKTFVADATAEGLDGLKGHRSVGGIRASIYNAFPEEGVDALAAFMREFERSHG
ncbi:MAG: 3-phosphoserine/phosphohydroxythreonine transaminase [Luteitalea sp.]|nr:3-phosphoserine/phosphohydroxythreonine transaminase [Luteitalea sp.]